MSTKLRSLVDQFVILGVYRIESVYISHQPSANVWDDVSKRFASSPSKFIRNLSLVIVLSTLTVIYKNNPKKRQEILEAISIKK